jgi:hypothetical protein
MGHACTISAPNPTPCPISIAHATIVAASRTVGTGLLARSDRDMMCTTHPVSMLGERSCRLCGRSGLYAVLCGVPVRRLKSCPW